MNLPVRTQSLLISPGRITFVLCLGAITLLQLVFVFPLWGQPIEETQVIDPDWAYWGWPDQFEEPGPGFGTSIAADGDWLVVGAPAAITYTTDAPDGEETGAMFVYRKAGGQWLIHPFTTGPISILVPTSGKTPRECGYSVAVTETTQSDVSHARAFGCIYGGAEEEGAVMLGYSPSPYSTQVHHEFGPHSDSEFGSSISLTTVDDGTVWAAIGAPRRVTDDIVSGSVKVLRRDPEDTVWQTEGWISPLDPALGDRFGHSVSISAVDDPVSGHRVRLAVGAPGRDIFEGAAYVFARTTSGKWNQIRKMTPHNGGVLDNFGRSVAYRTSPLGAGSMLAVGARNRKTGGNSSLSYRRGTVSVWHQPNIGGSMHVAEGDVEFHCVTNCSHLVQDMAYGASVAIDGDRIWIGAPNYDDGQDANVGRVFGAERINDQWMVTQTLSPGTLESDCQANQSAQPDGHFGAAIAPTRDGVAVGYPRRGCDGPPEGQVRLFGIADAIFSDRYQALPSP